MKFNVNNQQKLNEIVFANRNKQYGAYVLRAEYGFTLIKSLSIVITACISMIGFVYLHFRNNQLPIKIIHEGQTIDKTIIYDFLPKEPCKPETEEATKTQAKKSYIEETLSIETKIIDSLQNESSHQLATSSVSLQTDSSQSLNTEGTDYTKNGSKTFTTNTVGSSTDIKNIYEVDKEPEFEGGLNALYRFVASHVQYPEEASAAGKGGVVFIKFVVDESGRVGKVSVLNHLGFGLDDEAKRVVSLIPKFKSPAQANGQAVKVNYQLPIKFVQK